MANLSLKPAHHPIALLFIVVVILASFYPLFLGRYYAIGDIRDVYLPIEQFYHSQIQYGNLPAWLADAAWGFPVIASAQIGFFYPPLFLLRWSPPQFYLPFLLIFHFLALGVGSWLFYRRFVTSSAASLGAIALALGGFVVLHLTHLNIIFALAWLPWQFLFIYHHASKPLSFRFLSKLSLLLAIPFLVGQIQIPLLMLIISCIWFSYLRHRASYSWRTSYIFLLSAMLLIVALSAAQLLPTYELMIHSTRDPSASTFDVTRANQHSFPLYHLPTYIFPRFFNNDDLYWGRRLQIEYGAYIGTLPLILALSWLYRRRDYIKQAPRSQTNVIPFFLSLLVITFLLSLGSLSPFRLIKLEPSLWLFSAPARWLLFSSFALSFFAAVGADYFFRYPSALLKIFRRWLYFLTIVVIAGNIVLWLSQTYAPLLLYDYFSPVHQQKISSLLESARHSSLSILTPYTWIPLIIVWLISQRFILRYVIPYTLIITAIELSLLFVTTTPSTPWSHILTPPDTVSQLPASILTHQARLYSLRTGGDTGAYFTDPASRANEALRQQQKELLLPLMHTQFNLAGIEWPASLDFSSHAGIFADLRADNSYELSNPDLAKQLNIGGTLQHTNQSIVISPRDFAPRLELLFADNTSRAVPYPYSPDGSFTINTDLTQPATLIVRDSFYPGWLATIDNQPTTISAYQNIFRQIQVPAGSKSISFYYRPLLLYIGIITSTLTVSIIVFYLVIISLYQQMIRNNKLTS